MRTRVSIRVAATIAAFCVGLLLATVAAAKATGDGDANPHLWRPKIKSVAVFKNGLGFFLRQGEVELRDGWALAKDIPPAKFGTLAIYPTREDEIVDVVGSGPGELVEFDDVDAPSDIEHKRARLEAAQNLTIELTYRERGADRAATGKLISIGPDFAILESNRNSFAVPIAGISQMRIRELPLRVHVSGEGDKPPAKTEIGMAYLRDGITWIPEYTLRIVDDTTAELTLRGTLVNEAEDLVHCDVNFVVGVPHFVHTDYLAPIAVGQAIRTIGAAVAPREVASQIANRAAFGNNAIRADQLEGVGRGGMNDTGRSADESAGRITESLGNLPRLDAAGVADYTVYTKKDLTVRRGERAIVTLFVKKIRYSHIYRWSPPETMKHHLVLHNDTGTAWTTGPCLAISGDQPLSEDLMKYTPKGGRGELPVAASINVAHDKSEVEAERQFRAHSPSKDVFYDLVTLSGELKLKNFEKTEIEIVVSNPVEGKPTSASDYGILSTDSTRLKLLERAGHIRWQVKLQPGEAKVLQYKYDRFVPAN